MKIKRLIVLGLAIAVTSGTARSKDQYVVVRIECTNPNFELHFPKHIGADPKFEYSAFGDPIGNRTDRVTISAGGQGVGCRGTKYTQFSSNLEASYHYTVKRKVIGCTSVQGNPAALDCKVEP